MAAKNDYIKELMRLREVNKAMYEALKKVMARQQVIDKRVVERGIPSSEEILEIQKALALAEGKVK